ncbi:MAG: DNA-primase RepB domain-containing protein, partial [Planctomycetota bacterium]
ALVSSGRGWHAWWRLEDPIDPEAWTRHQVVLNGSVEGADASIKDPARILRLPGTVNQKRGEPVELVEFDANRVYPLSEFPEPIEDNAFAPSHTDSQPTRR